MQASTATEKLPACSTMPILRRNDKQKTANKDVKFLQTRLNTFGFSLNADGFFGKKTEVAVKEFQSRSEDPKFPVDGIVGPLTWQALNACVR